MERNIVILLLAIAAVFIIMKTGRLLIKILSIVVLVALVYYLLIRSGILPPLF